jgi:hypothetical protein
MSIKHHVHWTTVVDCHFCKLETPTKETHTILVDKEYFGVKGYTNVRICKECYREYQLNKLI